MSQQELKRAVVIQRVVAGGMTVQEAAEVLGLSVRHIKRMKKKFQQHGAPGLAHGNRGRKPVHTLSPEIRQTVLQLAKSDYEGCNFTFLSELLAERQGIHLSPASVGRILKAAGLQSPRKHRPPKLHRQRQRKPQFGMLVLVDGSHHDWLEGRGPWLCLFAAVDDATGRLVAARFRPTEDAEGYRQLLEQIVTTHGIPLALYSDRHAVFLPRTDDRVSLTQELLGSPRPVTQIGRMLADLGIEHIPARSPQAKGRVERAFLTLQERLRVALRLAKVSTLAEADAFLPGFVERYNERFAVAPAEAEVAFRQIPAHIRLEHVLCWKEQRTLHPGYVVRFESKTYRVTTQRGKPIIPLRAAVDVLEHPDGAIYVSYKGNVFPAELLPDATSQTPKPVVTAADAPQKEKAGSTSHRRPAADHPWRTPRAIPPKAHSTTSTVTDSLTDFR